MTKTKVDLDKYADAAMYKRFIQEKTPAVCVTGKFDVTNLLRYKKRAGFNAMMCYCIMQAGQNVKEFHYSIQPDGLYYYDNIKVNSVVIGKDGNAYYPDYRYCDSFSDFEKIYRYANDFCINNCQHLQEDTGALISTSAVIGYPFTSFSLAMSDTFWDNFLMWGKFVKKFRKAYLHVSLRFHHATIDGRRAANFFAELQHQINIFKM